MGYFPLKLSINNLSIFSTFFKFCFLIFTMLCWFLPSNNAKQPELYIHLLPPSPPSSLSFQVIIEHGYTAISQQLSILHLIAYICTDAAFSIHPTLSLPYCIHKSLHPCLHSFPANKFNNTFLYIPYTCKNILYLFFSFWLTSHGHWNLNFI